MSNKYIPQVGDRVRLPDENDRDAVTVTAVGERVFLGKFKDTTFEYAFRYGDDRSWVKVEPPPTYPESWLNVYPYSIGRNVHATRQRADDYALTNSIADVPGYARVAVIHLAADGTLTLHPTTGGAS